MVIYYFIFSKTSGKEVMKVSRTTTEGEEYVKRVKRELPARRKTCQEKGHDWRLSGLHLEDLCMRCGVLRSETVVEMAVS